MAIGETTSLHKRGEVGRGKGWRDDGRFVRGWQAAKCQSFEGGYAMTQRKPIYLV